MGEVNGNEPDLVNVTNLPDLNRSSLPVGLGRARRRATGLTPEALIWPEIYRSTQMLSFKTYKAFMDYLLCNDPRELKKLLPTEFDGLGQRSSGKYRRLKGEKEVTKKVVDPDGSSHDEIFPAVPGRRYLPFNDTDAYRLLKVATEAFLVVNCGVSFDRNSQTLQTKYDDFVSDMDMQELNPTDVNDWLNKFSDTNGVLLPYLALVKSKLGELNIKDKIFSERSPDAPSTIDISDDEANRCIGILMDKLYNPCLIELIWSYWHEEGMLVQTMNAITRRFQNVRGPADRDPLAMLELDPLRPLNNLLWGYLQDEQHRLSVVRRAYEYDHHYGLALEGKAIPNLRPADSRSKFIEAFHNLLRLAAVFYKQDDDTTVIADGFPLLNALRDLHMILAEGAHNQYGDLPTTARIEMLMQQWLLARPEFREVLPTRIMVAYPEPWMDRVDAMKKLQGWGDGNQIHFHNLAVFGEQVLLAIRFTAWSDIDSADMAAMWARFWRNQVQGYIHAYRTVTGVDLSAEVSTSQARTMFIAQPSTLLRHRLQNGPSAAALPAPATTASPSFRERKAART